MPIKEEGVVDSNAGSGMVSHLPPAAGGSGAIAVDASTEEGHALETPTEPVRFLTVNETHLHYALLFSDICASLR